MYMMLEWIATALGLFGTFLLAWSTHTRTAGWILTMLGSTGYLLVFVHSGNWGFVTGSIVYIILEILGLYRSIYK